MSIYEISSEKPQNWRTIVEKIFFFRIVGFFLQKKFLPEQFIIVIPRRNDFKICQYEGFVWLKKKVKPNKVYSNI